MSTIETRENNSEKAGLIITCIAFIFFIALALVSVFLLKAPVADRSASVDYDSYVKLGQYKGLSLSSAKAAVSDADVQERVDTLIESYGGIYVEDEAGVVDDGDQLEVAYCAGRSTSSAFDETTAQELTVIVGNSELPEEFVGPLVGHMTGDDVPVTMDDGTVYIVRILHVHQKGELTDDYVASLGISDVSTIDDLYSHMKDYLEKQALSNYKTAASDEIIALCYNNSSFSEMPDALVTPFKEVLQARLDNAVSANALQGEEKTYDDILKETYDKDGISSSDEYLELYGLQNARIYAMCLKIAKFENIKADEDEVYSLAASDWSNVRDNYSTLKEFIDANGLEVYRQAALLEKVKDYLFEINIGEK